MGHLMAAWGLRDLQASACVLRGQRGFEEHGDLKGIPGVPDCDMAMSN